MKEQLLQFIWQFQYYNKSNLLCANNEPLQVIRAGTHNTNQGPDFLEAQIVCGKTTLIGSIELHIKSSDWIAHKHSNDGNYNNVILHVVWQNDIYLGLPFPVLELKDRVSNLMLHKYEELMSTSQFIPCQNLINTVNELTLIAWKERLFVERLQTKASIIEQSLINNNHFWEQIFWQTLARNFGIKLNAEAFEQIAKAVPINILAKHKNQQLQIEGILMGVSGLLNVTAEDDYLQMLQKEFKFLKAKHSLTEIKNPIYFLRMRPANFPTIRLSQLAVLVYQSNHLFSKIKEATTLIEIESMFDVTANDYWHYHYTFGETSAFKKKNIGKQMIQNIIINTVLPVVYAYGWYNNNDLYKQKAQEWANQLLPEKNNITNGFQKLGLKNKSAFDSQAFIQLKNNYCDQKKCLECALGNKILKTNS